MGGSSVLAGSIFEASTQTSQEPAIATLVAFGALLQGALAHVHCCSCCKPHKNTCDYESTKHAGWGVPNMCSYQGRNIMCNKALAQNQAAFLPDCKGSADLDLAGLPQPITGDLMLAIFPGALAGVLVALGLSKMRRAQADDYEQLLA